MSDGIESAEARFNANWTSEPITAEQIAEFRKVVDDVAAIGGRTVEMPTVLMPALLDAAEERDELRRQLAETKLNANEHHQVQQLVEDDLLKQLVDMQAQAIAATLRVAELDDMLAVQSELAANGTAVINQVQERACELQRQLAERTAEKRDLEKQLAEAMAALHDHPEGTALSALQIAGERIAELERKLAALAEAAERYRDSKRNCTNVNEQDMAEHVLLEAIAAAPRRAGHKMSQAPPPG